MPIYNFSKRFLASILLSIHILTSCSSPMLGPDKSSSKPEEESNSHSSALVADSTKQEENSQDLALQTSAQEQTPVTADKQTLDLQTVKKDGSNEPMAMKVQGHTDTFSKAIPCNQGSFHEGGNSSKETKKIQTSHPTAEELGNLNKIPMEILKTIFSYVGSEGMGNIRQLNKKWYYLTTGYEGPGQIGLACKPQTNMLQTDMLTKGLDTNKKVVDCSKVKGLSPENVPSSPWYQLVGEVKDLPQCFWTYMESTQIHTLDLKNKQIGKKGAKELAKVLPSTQIQTLHLAGNKLGYEGVKKLAKVLPNTQVQTLDLSHNSMVTVGLEKLIKVLPSTQIHTLHLDGNILVAKSIAALAKVLASTKIHTLHLKNNSIGDEGVKELVSFLPSTQIQNLHLGGNSMGNEGAKELAKVLPSTQIQTLYLDDN